MKAQLVTPSIINKRLLPDNLIAKCFIFEAVLHDKIINLLRRDIKIQIDNVFLNIKINIKKMFCNIELRNHTINISKFDIYDLVTEDSLYLAINNVIENIKRIIKN